MTSSDHESLSASSVKASPNTLMAYPTLLRAYPSLPRHCSRHPDARSWNQSLDETEDSRQQVSGSSHPIKTRFISPKPKERGGNIHQHSSNVNRELKGRLGLGDEQLFPQLMACACELLEPTFSDSSSSICSSGSSASSLASAISASRADLSGDARELHETSDGYCQAGGDETNWRKHKRL